jgi:tetratricopeptide (TPR) repeat protein
MRWRAGLAGFQARAGDLAAAEATLAKVDPARLADDFDRAEAALNFAIVCSLQGRDEDALRLLADADRFLASQGNATMRTSPRVGLAMTHFRAGRAGEQIEVIEAAERSLSRQDGAHSPDLADLRMALGRARLDRGDTDGALTSLREAERFWMRFDPAGSDAARVQGHLALVLAARGESPEAAQRAADARIRLARSVRVDDTRLLADLVRAGL